MISLRDVQMMSRATSAPDFADEPVEQHLVDGVGRTVAAGQTAMGQSL